MRVDVRRIEMEASAAAEMEAAVPEKEATIEERARSAKEEKERIETAALEPKEKAKTDVEPKAQEFDARDQAESDDAEVEEKNKAGSAATHAKYAEVMSVLNVDTGLTSERVATLREKYGFNESVEKQKSLWMVFASKFWGATPAMIIIAMAIAFGLNHYVDGGVIAALLLINGCIAFHEDVKARRALAALMQKLQVIEKVKRDGEWMEIAAREIVPGDLIRSTHTHTHTHRNAQSGTGWRQNMRMSAFL